MESLLSCSSVPMINRLPLSSQTCLLNMTDAAKHIIYCMESSSDVIKAAQSVSKCVCVSVHLISVWAGVCLFPSTANIIFIILRLQMISLFLSTGVCSAHNSTAPTWAGTASQAVWKGTWETSWCIRTPWRPKLCSLLTNTFPGWP